MCQVCNDSLLAGANAARLLAAAAKDLYTINEHKASGVLANAAAELFEEAKPVAKDAPKAAPGTASGTSDSAEESDIAKLRRSLNDQLPEGVSIREDGALVLNGTIIGQAMLVRR